ncbi:metaxin-1 [Aplysia californica]|uniref:Metaxin n=1 Tax=Aplysia californica TaxID=6500 RepID=A0ABM0JA26_APLCA|nr:metaxin-1 [Aplysia californica]
MAVEKMKLDVWNGDWGLPSIDPHCLAVLAYCKFSGVPIEVTQTGNPWRSPTGTLPVLRNQDVVCTKVTDIFSYLRKEHWGSDFELSTKQSADVIAFSAMLEEKLLPALLHLWWMDDKTFVDVTRPWYSRVIPFPLNFFLPRRTQKKAEMRVTLTKGNEFITDVETEAKVYREAKECLNILSYKLGTKNYMFGNLPSSLDALVFGYLAPLLKAPLPNNQLQNHLKQCDNLVAMCNEILTSFFPANVKVYEEQMRKEEAEKKSSGSNVDHAEFPNRRRNMILAAIFALTAMVGYALSSGMIEVQVFDEEKPKGLKSVNSSKKSSGGGAAFEKSNPMFEGHREPGGE